MNQLLPVGHSSQRLRVFTSLFSILFLLRLSFFFPGCHFFFPMKPTILHALAHLRKKNTTSSTSLARELSISQQTASRWLIDLLRNDLIEKREGQYRITPSGTAYLSSLLPGAPIGFIGTVFTGLGEGKYYLGKSGYMKQFMNLLGFEPFPGTLNLKVEDGMQRQGLLTLRAQSGMMAVSGFTEKERTFGGARCHKVLIAGKIQGALIMPERTHYPKDVAELLAPVFLRKALGLKDGSSVSIQTLL